MVELQFSKLMAGVRFSHPALGKRKAARKSGFSLLSVRGQEVSRVTSAGDFQSFDIPQNPRIVIHMSNKNKVPIDAYSADEFKSNLGSLTESGVEYVPPSVEREKDEDWQVVNGAFTEEERNMVRRLDQLYVNARREAFAEDEKRTLGELIPPVLKAIHAMEEDARGTVERIGSDAGRVASVAKDFLREAKDARERLQGRAGIKSGAVGELYVGLREAHGALKRLASAFVMPDRFGNNKQEPLHGRAA